MSLHKKSWLLLNSKQKKYAFFIFVMLFIAMIFETISIGVVYPLLSILLKGDIDISFLNNFVSIEKPSGKTLIYIGLLITTMIFLIKNLVLAFNLWYQKKFLRKLTFELTSRLFKFYLKCDYIFFLQMNSAQLYRNLTDIVTTFVDYINRYVTLLSEIIVIVGIASVLFYIDFIGTISILFSVIVLAFLIYIFTIKKIKFLGNERNLIGGELNKHLLQGVSSAKDVKLLDREEDLIYQVDTNLLKMTKLNHMMAFINGLPKLLFEMLIIAVFVILVLFMIAFQKSTIDIIQYLGIFAVASYRIVPGASRLFSSYQMIKYLEPGVKLLLEEFSSKYNSFTNEKKSKNSKNYLQFDNNINLKNISFTYPVRKEFSLSKISLSIKKGDFVGIVGSTGSGKSTLINLLVGLLKPSEGQIEVDDLNINKNLSGWHKKIGYVPQQVYLTDDTIRKNIAFGLIESDIEDNLINDAVTKANLNVFLADLPKGLETVVGEKGIRLSGGQQQRIGIARALYRDPEILILDEATSSLDQSTEREIMESINFLMRKKTLIIITHRLTTVKNCDKIFYVDKGKITKQGSPEEILSNI